MRRLGVQVPPPAHIVMTINVELETDFCHKCGHPYCEKSTVLYFCTDTVPNLISGLLITKSMLHYVCHSCNMKRKVHTKSLFSNLEILSIDTNKIFTRKCVFENIAIPMI